MAQHRDRSVRRYESFSAAVDMFSQLEVQRAQAEHAAQEGAAWKKVARLNPPGGRVGDLVAQEEADAEGGAARGAGGGGGRAPWAAAQRRHIGHGLARWRT